MEQYIKDATKEQLEIFCHNSKIENDILRNKLFILTGCANFGNHDGTDGSCIDCFINNKELHIRCDLFQRTYDLYVKENKKVLN